jgi:hypothetical protein
MPLSGTFQIALGRPGRSLIPIFIAPLTTPADQVGTVPPGKRLSCRPLRGLPRSLAARDRGAGWILGGVLQHGRAGLTRIWPPYAPIGWPMPDISEWQLSRQRGYLPDMFQRAGFHLAGRTTAEVQEIMTDMDAGMSVEDLDSKWGLGYRTE